MSSTQQQAAIQAAAVVNTAWTSLSLLQQRTAATSGWLAMTSAQKALALQAVANQPGTTGYIGNNGQGFNKAYMGSMSHSRVVH